MALPLPVRVQKIAMTTQDATAYFEADPSDPWYGYPYKWRVALRVESQSHSNANTQSPFEYNIDDVVVGDWIATSTGGIAVQIVSIIGKTNGRLIVEVEDIDRFNTASDSTVSGAGIGADGNGYLFQLDEDGLPILGPILAYSVDLTFQSDLLARFQYRNLNTRYLRVFQPGHTFQAGQIIRPNRNTPGSYVLAAADIYVDEAIGQVSAVNVPTSEWFNVQPFGRIGIGLNLPEGGNYGDFWYIDPATPGGLTNIKPTSNARPIYMQLETSQRGIILNITTNSSSTQGEGVKMLEVTPTDGQLEFTIPGASEVVLMRINGIENTDFTFDAQTKVLTFDPNAAGYGVDATDEVVFVYKP
jgi:hypothetical protein